MTNATAQSLQARWFIPLEMRVVSEKRRHSRRSASRRTSPGTHLRSASRKSRSPLTAPVKGSVQIRRSSSTGTFRRSVVREEVSSFAINSAASSSECRSITRTNPNAIMQLSLLDSMRILGESTLAKAGATAELLYLKCNSLGYCNQPRQRALAFELRRIARCCAPTLLYGKSSLGMRDKVRQPVTPREPNLICRWMLTLQDRALHLHFRKIGCRESLLCSV